MKEERRQETREAELEVFIEGVRGRVRQEELQAEIKALVNRGEEAMRGLLSSHPDGYAVCMEGPEINFIDEVRFSNARNRRASDHERKMLKQGSIKGTYLLGFLIVKPYEESLKIDYRSRYFSGGDFEVCLCEDRDLEIIGGVTLESIRDRLSWLFDENGEFEKDSGRMHIGEVLTLEQLEDRSIERGSEFTAF